MAATINQILQERAKVIAQARKINDEHADKDGKLPAEHQQAFDLAMKEAGEKLEVVNRLKALEGAEGTLQAPIDGAPPVNPLAQVNSAGGDGASEFVMIRSATRGERGEVRYEKAPAGQRGGAAYRAAFNRALRHGAAALQPTELAAIRSDDAEAAGYLVASEQFAAGVLQAVDDLVFIRQHATVHPVPEADSLGIRKRTSKANTFSWSSELSLGTEDAALAYGKKVLTPHPLTGQITVSRDLLRRTMNGADAIVRDEMARDAAEKLEDAYLLGSGAGQPLGVFVASNDGIPTSRDVLTGSATNFTADGLIAAKYTMKQPYRNGGARSGARWMFHRDGISKIAQLKDANNQYLLQPNKGLTGDEFDMLLGYPVDESERCPNTFTTGLYVGLLANWSYYEIADALDLEIQVLIELFAQTNQVGYIGRIKTDGMPTLDEAFVRIKTS